MADRKVVLLCGPPGAGKTTLARQLAEAEGLEVFDLDDDRWESEMQFRATIRRLGSRRKARAVVIRSGATLRARHSAAVAIRATEVRIIDTPAEVCRRRVISRKRQPPSIRTQLAAVDSWWQRYQPGPVFLTGPRLTPRAVDFFSPRGKTSARGYGAAHQAARAKLAPAVAAGTVVCPRCGEPIAPGEPWDLGHDDADRSRYVGAEHRRCNRATAGRRKRRTSREW